MVRPAGRDSPELLTRVDRTFRHASLRVLRQPTVHVDSGLKQLDAFHHGIALASARQSGCFGFKPGSMLCQPLLE
jgi:hypothetical protein